MKPPIIRNPLIIFIDIFQLFCYHIRSCLNHETLSPWKKKENERQYFQNNLIKAGLKMWRVEPETKLFSYLGEISETKKMK